MIFILLKLLELFEDEEFYKFFENQKKLDEQELLKIKKILSKLKTEQDKEKQKIILYNEIMENIKLSDFEEFKALSETIERESIKNYDLTR
ncbi:hypothetical protein SJPD1_2197 [Sulfurospirillum diekertiae]|uniref:Uncharacterized protein n=1 Tax=Sulfurospirillum diekertiae TaxID=1854492 RepID=A0A290HFX5_9BACT|nr:hypothetical protein [Sulfurospirillum diekertiae]ATB70295.1 hypothetical protein SJPD1_2197 [Sulfurospirillum diekertiae]